MGGPGDMSEKGNCELCSMEAKHVCAFCGKHLCEKHWQEHAWCVID